MFSRQTQIYVWRSGKAAIIVQDFFLTKLHFVKNIFVFLQDFQNRNEKQRIFGKQPKRDAND